MPSGQPVAFVTGATEGIGRAIALTLGGAGYRIGACARTPSRLRDLHGELTAAGITAAVHPADVSEPADVETMVAELERALGPADVLVNNAGIAILKPFEELTLDDWDTTMATNLRSLYLVTRAVLPGMRRRRHGAIVNIASLAGKNGFAGGTAYAASKHAVMGFSRSLMLEVRKDDIRVITICPGSVDTPLLHGQSVLKPNFERILRPEDVAATVLAALSLPDRATVSELEVRPTNP
ncbi:MAG TPA: SDR family NAD(P)-dependent oxidoreductase [Gemmatimonadales bacterium]|jgi:3-oxoacyl-[acyl-carrier protein] reductase|nr:SDR family NAD(P)-dependent oxidoreductase [Gemmatimonadales bacterium]